MVEAIILVVIIVLVIMVTVNSSSLFYFHAFTNEGECDDEVERWCGNDRVGGGGGGRGGC